jgi:hypothetical protein
VGALAATFVLGFSDRSGHRQCDPLGLYTA